MGMEHCSVGIRRLCGSSLPLVRIPQHGSKSAMKRVIRRTKLAFTSIALSC